MKKKPRSARRQRKPRKRSKYRTLYLMERTSQKSGWSTLLSLSELKIGVTNNLGQRLKTIQKDMPGEVKLITHVDIPGQAQVYESKLLRKYKDMSFIPKGAGEGAGKSEWIRVTWMTYSMILSDFWAIRNRWMIRLFILAILATLMLFYPQQIQ